MKRFRKIGRTYTPHGAVSENLRRSWLATRHSPLATPSASRHSYCSSWPLWLRRGRRRGAEMASPASARQQAVKDVRQGNFKDAYELYRKLALDPASDARKAGEDLNAGTDCLVRLNCADEIDAFREAVIAAHQNRTGGCSGRRRENYMRVPHNGFLIAGKFERGPHRGGGQDGQRRRARPGAGLAVDGPGDAAGREGRRTTPPSAVLPRLGRQCSWAIAEATEAWRLQYLTDLAHCPTTSRIRLLRAASDQTGRRPGRRRRASRSSTTCPRACGRRPTATASGGGGALCRRWSSTRAGPDEVRMHFADFLTNQFGVQTMAVLRLDVRPHGGGRHEEERKRHLRCAHAGRRRDHRPAGHRHQAVQAARRVQLHQDLPADWPRKAKAGQARCAGARWPRSSRTAGNIPRRPTTGGRRSRLGRRRPEHRRRKRSWTRSSATGAGSSRS